MLSDMFSNLPSTLLITCTKGETSLSSEKTKQKLFPVYTESNKILSRQAAALLKCSNLNDIELLRLFSARG